MIVNFYGKQFLRLQYGDFTVAYNPEAGGKTKFGADLMISTMNHPDFHGLEAVTYGDKVPFVVDGPGAYEIQEIPILGAMSTVEYEGKKMINTSYLLEFEGMRIAMLGHINSMDALSSEAREKLGEADIVVATLGAGLPPSKVYSLAKSFSPSYVLVVGDAATDSLVTDILLGEANQDKTPAIDKWTVKPKDLIGKEAEIVLLSV